MRNNSFTSSTHSKDGCFVGNYWLIKGRANLVKVLNITH